MLVMIACPFMLVAPPGDWRSSVVAQQFAAAQSSNLRCEMLQLDHDPLHLKRIMVYFFVRA
jgi:hypothetical protein